MIGLSLHFLLVLIIIGLVSQQPHKTDTLSPTNRFPYQCKPSDQGTCAQACRSRPVPGIAKYEISRAPSLELSVVLVDLRLLCFEKTLAY